MRFTILAALLTLGPRAAPGAPLTSGPRVVYTSPVPGARYVRPGTGLIVRLDRELDAAGAIAFRVTGSRSGLHDGRAMLARDRRTLLFQPARPFEWGESVEVALDSTLPLDPGALGAHPRLAFTIAAVPVPASPATLPSPLGSLRALTGQAEGEAPPSREASAPPSDPPLITTTWYQTPAPGRLFMSSIPIGVQGTPYLMIVGNAGGSVFARPAPQFCTDFKVQPDGRLTYYDTNTTKFYAMDSSYAVIDSFHCGNDFYTDLHELRLLPGGHAILMGIDLEIVDMSVVVPGGNPAAAVSGLVIQELDADRNVIFQWRSWDHFQITDATHEDLTAASIDYVHGNAVEVDTDGNLLLSSRHMDEITKIDRTTGDMVWRMGGKNNQFTLVGDTLWFSHQHAIRRIANGNVTLFDNGNFHDPPFSRAVEYTLDETNHTAQMVWQFRNTPDSYGNAMGYVQRLDNGSTLISWGTGKPDVIEVAPDGSKVMEMSLPAGVASYRVFRQDWSEPGLASASLPAHLALSLSPGWPNPFRTETAMFANLPAPAAISVRVVDVQGRELRGVARAIPEGAGAYRVSVDLSGREAGVYFCQVSSVFGGQTRRIVHLN
jgi:hypothetical protein